jgi:hypothetical protein
VTNQAESTPTGGRALVVYESFFGNTAHIADAVAGALRLDGWSARVVDVARFDDAKVAGIDLLVVGAPTHAFSMSRPSTRTEAAERGGRGDYERGGMREWLEELSAASSPEPLAATFDTRVSKVRHLPASAARTAARTLRRKGFRLLGKPAGFIVQDVEGPLESRETEHAIAWARAIVREAETTIAARRTSRV